ncbi:transmembrane alpha-helix domain-containing protein [Diplodia corticola]|uniref:Transmembrane alpha-helix domain-containing protein n=1 Tax=Diplodia corticola TaxID=236234 RepID=A0A1J9S7K7_9PEZI|nr:transmembrane alpha-helix domain-containing protein [Diplodia corticola]OJD35581.1 transmembrane alpha-helix domain-containing protein [Diplodia corticola]
MTAYLGPLTTTWTPSASDCLTSFFFGSNSIGPWLQLGTTATSSCLPPNFNRDVSYFYSPGICPSGYTGYFCMGNIETSQIFNCVSAFPTGGTYTVDSISFPASGTADTGTTTVTVTQGETVRAYGPIVRRASDDPSWSNVIPTSTTSAASAGSSADAGTAAATAGAGGSSSSDGGGLSGGAKAGIGVGVAVGVLLIAAACVGGFMVGKRADRKRVAADYEKRRGGVAQEMTPVQELSAANARHELHPASISELDGGAQRK